MKHDLNSKVFGKWTVVKELGPCGKSRDVRWECQCQCGRIGNVLATYLVNGKSKQCDYCNKHSKKYYATDSIPPQFWRQIVTNAKKRGIQLHLSPEQAYQRFRKQGGKCALSGMLIEFPKCATEWKNNPKLASLDRIDNARGYEIDNIQWLHKDVNRMKNIHEQSYFLDICRQIVDTCG